MSWLQWPTKLLLLLYITYLSTILSYFRFRSEIPSKWETNKVPFLALNWISLCKHWRCIKSSKFFFNVKIYYFQVIQKIHALLWKIGWVELLVHCVCIVKNDTDTVGW